MKKFGILLLVLVFTALACSLTPNNDADNTNNTAATEAAAEEMSTLVAASLTADAGDGGSTPGDSPEPGETDTAEPTATTAPTNTPEPQPLRVAYVDNDNLQLWTEGVGSVMLYTGQKVDQVLLSDDGQVILFKTVDSNWLPIGLYRINTDGSNLMQLITGPEFVAMATDPYALTADIYQMTFVPGTHTVTFNTRQLFEGPGLSIQNEIKQVDTNTGLVTVLFTAAEPSNFHYSPDGSQIALSDHNSISLINANGTNLRPDVITFPVVNTASEYSLFPPPTWAPDSSYLRVVIPSAEPWGPGAYITVYNIPVDGSPGTSIGVFTGLPFFNFHYSGISPDMQKLIYHTQFGPPANNQYEIHIVDLAGGIDTVYSNGSQVLMRWAPDSEHFVLGRAGSPTLLGRIGFGSMALTDVVTVQAVYWVDSTRFIFTTGSHASWEIRLGSLGAPSILIAAPTADFISLDYSN